MSKPASWREKSACWFAQTELYWSLTTYGKSAFPYQNFAKNAAVKKQATSAAKPLEPLVRRMRENILSYALKAA
jgi:hypothetical protein